MVWKLYDLPLNPDSGIGTEYNDNNGTDWTLGPPSKLGELPHDGGMGLDGNLYYTVNNPNRLVTIGKVDGTTGEVSYLKVAASNGEAATAHGLARDAHRQLLVRRESGPPQPGQARYGCTEDHRLRDARRR